MYDAQPITMQQLLWWQFKPFNAWSTVLSNQTPDILGHQIIKLVMTIVSRQRAQQRTAPVSSKDTPKTYRQ